MIRIKLVAGIALIALTVTVMAVAAEERMRSGLWEVTTAEGKQTGSLGTTCYTPAMVQLANLPEKMMREATEKTYAKRGCTLKDFKLEGNRMSLSNVCPTSSAVILSTYSGDTFETVDTRTMNGVTKVIRMKGRRVGECK
jgi:Protein of unknown function (DUF3617)